MAVLEGLSSTQKLLAAGGAGLVGLLFLTKRGAGGGGGEQGIAVVDVRRPTDDINTPGSIYGDGTGFDTIARITQSYNNLLGSLLPNAGNTATGPGGGPTPTNPTTPQPGPAIPVTPAPTVPQNPAPKQSAILLGAGSVTLNGKTYTSRGSTPWDNLIIDPNTGKEYSRGDYRNDLKGWQALKTSLGLPILRR